MDDNKKLAGWNRSKSIAATLMLVLVLGYAGFNLVFQLPYLRFAMDRSWNLESRRQYLDEVVNGRALGQEQLLNLYAECENLLGKQMSNGFQVARDEAGNYYYVNYDIYHSYNYQAYGQRLKQVMDTTKAQGGEFLFLLTPNLRQWTEGNTGSIPTLSYTAQLDALAYYMQGYGVPFLDSRQNLALGGFDSGAYQYRTDPGWTISASFTVFGGILEEAQSRFALELDPEGFYADERNYTKTTYENSFLGEFGRTTGAPFTEMEDFVLYTPDFETDFTMSVTHYNETVTREGSFEEVLLAPTLLTADNPYERIMTNAYLGGQAPRRVITNNLNQSGPKILVIGDAYTAPLAVFLSPLAGELHMIWPYDNPEVGDLGSYIRANDFDLILMGLSPGNLTPDGLRILDLE